MTAPLLSVVIPAWNRAGIVCDAIGSALRQRDGAVEVLLVDDCSTDGTRDTVRARFGHAVRYFRTDERRGPGAARNEGARHATGELVAFLDSDDLWRDGKLDAELRALSLFPDAEAVISDSRAFTEGVADTESRFARNGLLAATRGEVRPFEDCRWAWVDSRNGVQTGSITVRRDALSRLGPTLFAEDLHCCEDWEFQLRVYHHCRVVVLPEILAHVRRFDDGTRLGRAIPGQPRTREQELGLLRARLTVLDRAHWLTGLDSWLSAELARFRDETVRELALAGGGEA